MWGPNARATIQKIADAPDAWSNENFPFAALRELKIKIKGVPVLNPATGATLIDALGRRSYTNSIAFGPSTAKNIALAYLPHAYAQVGRELQIQYFADVYPVKVEAVGYRSLYDAENIKPRS